MTNNEKQYYIYLRSINLADILLIKKSSGLVLFAFAISL